MTPSERGAEAGREDQRSSPRGDFLKCMAEQEDEALKKCMATILEMRAATRKQKNISVVIKNGLDVLEEALSVIRDCRAVREAEPVAPELVRSLIEETLTCASGTQASAVLADRTAGAHEGEESNSTPSTSQKRPASSPADGTDSKQGKQKKKEAGPEPWTEVTSKSKKKAKKKAEGSARPKGPAPLMMEKRAKKGGPKPSDKPQKEKEGPVASRRTRRRTRPDVLIVRPSEGKSYADILREIRAKAKPEESKAEVRSLRRTRAGDVLLELGRKTEDKAAFGCALKALLGDSAKVSVLEKRSPIEIKDLDELTTPGEVEQAIRRDLPEMTGELKVWLTEANQRGLRMAVVDLSETAASSLLKQRHIKVGWVSCRMRLRTVVQRCHRCLSYGHLARNCRGPNRAKLCGKCCKEGHVAKDCKAPMNCFLCAEKGVEQANLTHVPGSGKCAVFRDALNKAKKSAR